MPEISQLANSEDVRELTSKAEESAKLELRKLARDALDGIETAFIYGP